MHIPIKIRAFFSRNYLLYSFITRETLETFLEVFGVLWLIVEITAFFSADAGVKLRDQASYFYIIGFISTLWIRRPLISVSERLPNRDVEIEIRVGNIFEIDRDWIISTNTTFDTALDNKPISENSLQGQFTKYFYPNVTHLDRDIEESLKGQPFTQLDGKRVGKNKRYKLGTVVKLELKKRLVYLVAVAHMNEHGVCEQTPFESVQDSLASTWEYIARCGDISPLVIPLIGSGHARVCVSRETIAKEIIKSFVAACSSIHFCKKLTIIISPDDYHIHQLNLYELRDYLRYVCRYTDIKLLVSTGSSSGTGIS